MTDDNSHRTRSAEDTGGSSGPELKKPKLHPTDISVGSSVPENQTLYVHNLNDKVKVETLKRTLYLLFSPYGTILAIVMVKSSKMRGQAHIVFASVEDAQSALKSLNSSVLFGKPLKIEYSHSKSKVIALLDGTFRLENRDGEERNTGGDEDSVIGYDAELSDDDFLS